METYFNVFLISTLLYIVHILTSERERDNLSPSAGLPIIISLRATCQMSLNGAGSILILLPWDSESLGSFAAAEMHL
jgi:hypothetical protein